LAPDRWSRDWVARASAAANFVTVALEAGMDRLASQVAQPAQAVGEVARVPDEHIQKFADELVATQSPGILAELVEMLEGPLRTKDGGGPPWAVASQGHGVATGRVLRKNSLLEVKGAVFQDPTILLVDGGVSSTDDIPVGVVAVVALGGVEQMGNLAINARGRKVLLAGCHDGRLLAPWAQYVDSAANVAITSGGEVVITAATPYTGPKVGPGWSKAAPMRTSAWVIAEDHFTEDLVGAKALKCRSVRAPAALRTNGRWLGRCVCSI
jgi:hypothetical protein